MLIQVVQLYAVTGGIFSAVLQERQICTGHKLLRQKTAHAECSAWLTERRISSTMICDLLAFKIIPEALLIFHFPVPVVDTMDKRELICWWN